ncbi:MAG: hypothetical protein IJL69_05890 [Oscillospiraceae bacterium]|nr:hypothetical protein [Oscillospiraceae bacterium]
MLRIEQWEQDLLVMLMHWKIPERTQVIILSEVNEEEAYLIAALVDALGEQTGEVSDQEARETFLLVSDGGCIPPENCKALLKRNPLPEMFLEEFPELAETKAEQ